MTTTDVYATQDHAILRMPDLSTDEAIALSGLSQRDLTYYLINQVHALAVSHDHILELTTGLIGEVAPMIEQVSNGPIGKMLGIKS